jgi:hypothetical protein
MGWLKDITNPFDTKHPLDNPGGYLLGKYAFKGQNKADSRLNAIQVNRSAYGLPVPLVYGQTRIPISLAWYGGFTAVAHTEKQQGGKGVGGSNNTNTTYTYTASIVGLLCEGQINSTGTYWVDKEKHTSLGDLSLTLFTGAGSQSVWSYLTTNFPSEAIPYDHTAYIAAASMDLGSSASLPNLTFEVRGLQCFTPSSFDAEPSDIIIDYCTDPNHGCGFPYLATIQGAGATTYESYCIAMGFLISPQETQQRQAVAFLREILQITNSDAVWSPGTGLKIIPYADQAITNNGRTYTPDLTPLYAFGDSDYIYDEGSDPVIILRTPPSQTYNKVRVEYLDRDHDYNTAVVEASDDQDITLNGERVMETVTLHAITTLSMARQVAQILLQRQLYIRNTFQFKVRADFSLLEPMDLVSITDSSLGILNQLVRIIQTDDDESDEFTITAEEMLVGTASAPVYDTQATAGFIANYAVAPGAVQAPLIFTAPQYLVDVNGGYEIWIALAGVTHATWGGCDVYFSLDNVSYAKVGTHYGPSRYGSLTATFAAGSDPDTSATLSVSMADSTMSLTPGTQADADEMRTLLYVDGEICSYRYVTLTGVGAYTFTSNGTSGGSKYMRRGKYGSLKPSHASGSKWARIDEGLFRVQYDPGWIGKTVYFKFPSFNVYSAAKEDLASATAYTHVLADANSGSLLPSGATLVARGNCAVVGDSIFKSGGASAWDSDCYSIEAFSAGCELRFRSAVTTGVGYMIGLNSDPTTDQSYTSLDHAWYQHETGNQWYLYESGAVAGGPFGAISASDVPMITYDGIVVRYFLNGVVKREVQNPGKVFFLDSSFLTPGAAVERVYFGAQSSQPMQPFITRGNLGVVGNTIQCVSNTGSAWAADCYSRDAYSAGCQLRFRALNSVATANFVMMGLNSDPTTDQGYTSLDHAWYVAGNQLGVGRLVIYENGTGVQDFGVGQYGDTTMLAITYDGQFVRYFRDGVEMRKIENPGKAFFFDSSFNCTSPQALIVDLDFSPLNSAPSTGFIARGNCVVVGNSIQKVGGANAWDSDCYSAETFANGCAVSWRAQAAANDNYFIGLNSDPTTDQSYTSLDFGIEVYGAGGPGFYIVESGTTVAGPLTAAANDVFSIRYDGQWVRYYRNGAVVREKFAPGLTLFMDSSFATPGSIALDVSYGPLTSATPSPFIARGNCKVSDTNVIKQGGSSAWDSDCYSIVGYPVCHVSFKANGTAQDVMVGLNSDPTTDQIYTSIDYAWFPDNAGTLNLYENGALISTYGTYTAATVLAITYDGANARYYKDGVLVRTAPAAVYSALFMDSSFYQAGAGINSLRFGPTTNLAVNDTAQIGQNAATRTGDATMDLDTTGTIINGATVRSTTSGTTHTAEFTIPSPPFDCAIIVTITYSAYINAGSSGVFIKSAFSDNNGSSWSYSADKNGIPTVGQAAAGGNTIGTVQAQFAHSAANAGPMKADLAIENLSGGSVSIVLSGKVQLEAVIR